MKAYCQKHGLIDSRIEYFVRYIESAASAGDIVEWDAMSESLELTGLGDPIPEGLPADSDFENLITAVREISASQMYAAWRPELVDENLESAIGISQISDPKRRWPEMYAHDPGRQGWGSPIPAHALPTE